MSAKKLFKMLSIVSCILCITLFATTASLSNSLPSLFKLTDGEAFDFEVGLQVRAQRDMSASVETSNTESGNRSYDVNLKLFGIIPIKTATVVNVEETMVVVGGTPFGIEIFTDGVMVVSVMSVETENGVSNPGKDAGVQIGDIILAIDGQMVSSNAKVAEIIEQSAGNTLTFSMKRNDTSFSKKITPVKSATDGKFKAGLWVRDSSAGIGTLTFYMPKSRVYGGLGHAVCDVDTGNVLPIMTGEIFKAVLDDVVKSEKGSAGQLKGHIVAGDSLGSLFINCEAGVYGLYSQTDGAETCVPVAMRQQVRQGNAQIVTTVDDGGKKAFDCVIESINYKDDTSTQDMVIKITDEELLSLTGGIIQGMSGSPIIQNGMLVGAVTHVFVNQPSKGYGIFAETMLNYAMQLEKKASKIAS